MKKSGNWIAAIGAELNVSRVVVEAVPTLDLVQVSIANPDLSQVLAVYNFDHVEAAALFGALGRAVDQLEHGAITLAAGAVRPLKCWDCGHAIANHIISGECQERGCACGL